MVRQAQKMYNDLSPETGEFIDFMIRHGLMDLKNKPGKVSAGDMAGGQDHRWEICDDGSIMWVVDDAVPHYDHIEMSGESVSLYLQLCSGYA